MALFKKTVLPLSHGEQLRSHMSVFTETLNSLETLEEVIESELSDLQAQAQVMSIDLENTRTAISRVKKVTG